MFLCRELVRALRTLHATSKVSICPDREVHDAARRIAARSRSSRWKRQTRGSRGRAISRPSSRTASGRSKWVPSDHRDCLVHLVALMPSTSVPSVATPRKEDDRPSRMSRLGSGAVISTDRAALLSFRGGLSQRTTQAHCLPPSLGSCSTPPRLPKDPVVRSWTPVQGRGRLGRISSRRNGAVQPE